MKAAHPWLTQKSDWSMCALLAITSSTPAQINSRMESIYTSLRERDFQRSDELQAAAQILYFHDEEPQLSCARFQTLFQAFKQSGLWRGRQDYDEIALLCFARQDAAVVLASVERHRATIAALPHLPDKQASFDLACGTTLLELARQSRDLERLPETQLLLNIHAILTAQQAATRAAAS